MRIIAGIALLAVVLVVGGLLWSLFGANSEGMDRIAARRIDQICGFQRECKVRMGDLFAGDWDTFYEFGAGLTQAEVDGVLGAGRARTGDLQRLLVLTRNGKVVSSQLEDGGVETPLDQEVEFDDERHRDRRWVAIQRDTWLRVNRFPVQNAKGAAGTFYVLSNETP
jgi:hypothetical protein